MPRQLMYEYKTVKFSEAPNLDEVLNSLGEHGWHVVAVVGITGIILERPIN